MKKETNPKAKRNDLWCNVLIVAALLLIVAVLMVVLRRNAPANVDANAPLLPLTATDAPTETELATSTPEAAATPEITAAPEATAAPEVTDVPEATATPDLSQVKAFLVVTVGDKTYQPIPLTEEGYYRFRHGDCINIVHVTPTSIDMHEANCDNQDCVEQGEVTLENKDTRILGNMIICLPNQVTLQLYSRDELMDWLTTVQEDAANE
ncbi:MAG: NusG domain II-containing protein [Christensenellales bacterium]|nr:NusG domain II-containing protein [Christensenellales bacterium]